MIYLDDIENAVQNALPPKVVAQISKREMLMLAVDLNILHEKQANALYNQHASVTSTIIRDERMLCKQKCFRWKALTIAGWAIAVGSLFTLSIMGI